MMSFSLIARSWTAEWHLGGELTLYMEVQGNSNPIISISGDSGTLYLGEQCVELPRNGQAGSTGNKIQT